jgi:16S rRNA (guanine527-N7)-methyltransferase
MEQFQKMEVLYREWNSKINVVSRKDIDELYRHHVLHSLGIAAYLKSNMPYIYDRMRGEGPYALSEPLKILDLGTGGGFPGIPLAILFPECQFVLIDSIRKKILVATEIAKALGLTNVICKQERAEEEKQKFDFIVSRAVMPMPDLVKLVRKNVKPTPMNAIPNGLIVLKGGDLKEELRPFKEAELIPCTQWFKGEWFDTKQVIYLPL